MKFYEFLQEVLSKTHKVDFNQADEIIRITLNEMKSHIKKHPVKGTIDIIKLIFETKWKT